MSWVWKIQPVDFSLLADWLCMGWANFPGRIQGWEIQTEGQFIVQVCIMTRLASLAPGAGVAVLAGADLGADALAAVHAVRQADGALAVVALVATLATTGCT